MSEELSGLVTVNEAIALIDSVPVQPKTVRVRLENAQGLRLAQQIVADRDYPPFDKSLMDGFAVRAADVQNAPVDLIVAGEIAAGQRPARPLEAGQAFAIMTGAPLPEGADAVVPIEDVLPLPSGEGGGEGASENEKALDSQTPLTLTLSRGERGQEKIRILRAIAAGKFITFSGADCRAGQTVLPRGKKLEAAQLAVAASVGAAEVEVFARPRVAVLSTGDELVAIDAKPQAAQIRNSNNIMLVALLKRLGCEVIDLGTVRDDPELIRSAIERGFQFDALFVTGGMSMGRYDFVPKILVELGVNLKITKLRIKPGKPFVFGSLNEKFVFGLPGNPVSSFVCVLRLCSRLLGRMAGGRNTERWIAAKLESPLEANGAREFYQPAVLENGIARPLKWKGSADIYTLAAAGGLILREENAPALPAGAEVRVLEIPS